MRRANNRRYYQQNRETVKARVKAWTEANPDRAKERSKEWREANPDVMREYQREWYQRNREEVIARTRARDERLRIEQPKLYAAQKRDTAARRRARLREAFVEIIEPLRVWERDAGICGICGEAADPADWHLDHIIPIAKGGEHSYANVCVTHPICNWRKAAS
jgi:5-methylcytosine-specific restriction endonuclease McrA